MQNYELTLKAPISDSFMAKKAMMSVDLDAEEKSWHTISIKGIDVETEFNVGMIYGASGSGKSSLARHMFGEDALKPVEIDPTKAVIDQFPEDMSYDDRQNLLNSIGLSQVPCWIKPIGLLSNGQQERAKVALNLAVKKDLYVFDEWTSVVDRNVAKVMSHAVQKYARRNGKRVILISCHNDVFEWLNPCFFIDCNTQSYQDRRADRQGYVRSEKLEFTVREVDKSTWRNFSKYHYLSDSLPGGIVKFYGLFLGDKQIGFQCFANYVPVRGKKITMHSNRTVIHPDYVGFGLGMRIIDITSQLMLDQGYKVMAKYSSTPVFKSMVKNPLWKFREKMNDTPQAGGTMMRKSGFRKKVTSYSFEFIGSQPSNP
jgi:energy-coupling factor transporter ATP-binding protein EcfA2